MRDGIDIQLQVDNCFRQTAKRLVELPGPAPTGQDFAPLCLCMKFGLSIHDLSQARLVPFFVLGRPKTEIERVAGDPYRGSGPPGCLAFLISLPTLIIWYFNYR